jgi:hypothetical protein
MPVHRKGLMTQLIPRLPLGGLAVTHGEQVPAAIVAGLTLMAGAFGLDIAAHWAALESVEPTAHAAGMLGMVITWSAVVVDGFRHTVRRA